MIFRYDIEVSNYVNCVEQPKLEEEHFLGIHNTFNYLDIKNVAWTQIWGDND